MPSSDRVVSGRVLPENAPVSPSAVGADRCLRSDRLVTVHIESRGEAHALTFSEIPYVVGLLFADPIDLLLARLISGLFVLGVVRRQSLHKLLFNLSIFAPRPRWLRSSSHARHPNDPVGVEPLAGRLLAGPPQCYSALTLAVTAGDHDVQRLARASDGPRRCSSSAGCSASLTPATGFALVESIWEEPTRASWS